MMTDVNTLTRGGIRKGAGRPKGSKATSRLIQKHYRVNPEESKILEDAALMEGVALSKFVADAAIESAKTILKMKRNKKGI